MSHGSRDTLLVILIAGSLFFIGLGAPLLEPQESRYAEIPRRCSNPATGSFLI